MLDRALLRSIVTNLMSRNQVEVQGQKFRVRRTSTRRLRNVRFTINGHECEAIEQNPRRWGKLGKDGHLAVQFRDVVSKRYIYIGFLGLTPQPAEASTNAPSPGVAISDSSRRRRAAPAQAKFPALPVPRQSVPESA